MDPVSEKNLAQVDPALAAKIRAAADVCAATGLYFCAYSGLRTAAQQDADYAKGRTAPGSIVTNAKAGQSMHNYGLAADIVPFLAGESGALNWNPASAQYDAMVAALKAQGLEWGGDWVHFKDLDHFQMQGLRANPSDAMVADFEAETDLPTIWAKAANGSYA